jgi:hypothetical protein
MNAKLAQIDGFVNAYKKSIDIFNQNKSTTLSSTQNRHQPVRQLQAYVKTLPSIAQGAAGSLSLVTFFLRKKESDNHRQR